MDFRPVPAEGGGSAETGDRDFEARGGGERAPKGGADVDGSPSKLAQSRSMRSLMWSSVDSAGASDDEDGGRRPSGPRPTSSHRGSREKPSSARAGRDARSPPGPARNSLRNRRGSPDRSPGKVAHKLGGLAAPDLVVVNSAYGSHKPAGRKSAGSGRSARESDSALLAHRRERFVEATPSGGDRVASAAAGGQPRSWRSASARGHRADVRSATTRKTHAASGARAKINSASAAHRQQRVKEFQVLSAASPASPRLTVGGHHRREAPPPSPMVRDQWKQVVEHPSSEIHEVIGSAIVGDDDDWGESRDVDEREARHASRTFGDWPTASPVGHFHRPPSRQKGAFPTHLNKDGEVEIDAAVADDRAGAGDDETESIRDFSSSPDKKGGAMMKPGTAALSPTTRKPSHSARGDARRRRESEPCASEHREHRDRDGRFAEEHDGAVVKKLQRPPSRQKMPKCALFLDIGGKPNTLPLGPATFAAPSRGSPHGHAWMRGAKMPRYEEEESQPAAQLVNPLGAEAVSRASPEAAVEAKSRAPLGDTDVDRYHDPEADGFTAIDEPTPCPFRIQVTQNDGRSTVLLNDLGFHAAKSTGHHPTASSGDELDAPHARDHTRAVYPGPGAVSPTRSERGVGDCDSEGHGGRAPRSGAAPRSLGDWEGLVAPRDTIVGGAAPGDTGAARRPPSAGAGRRANVGRQRPQSAIPSTYKHTTPVHGTPRAIFDGHHGTFDGGGASSRKTSAIARAVETGRRSEDHDRRFFSDNFAAEYADTGAPKGLPAGKPLFERASSSPAVADPLAAADMGAPIDDGIVMSASGSAASLGTEEDDLLEVASGSSFCDDDDPNLGAQMLETNLGEEFLSLFAPITDH